MVKNNNDQKNEILEATKEATISSLGIGIMVAAATEAATLFVMGGCGHIYNPSLYVGAPILTGVSSIVGTFIMSIKDFKPRTKEKKPQEESQKVKKLIR